MREEGIVLVSQYVNIYLIILQPYLVLLSSTPAPNCVWYNSTQKPLFLKFYFWKIDPQASIGVKEDCAEKRFLVLNIFY